MLYNAKNGSVQIGNTDMYYASFGYGRRSFVILPGLSDGLATVKNKALFLAKPYGMFFEDFTVYMFSRKNDMPKGYTISDMADDQAEAMKKLGIIPSSVMGVSEGGMIAQMIAIRHPEAVDRLVLAVTAPDCNETARACIHTWKDYAGRNDHKDLMIDTAEKSYSDEYLKKYRKIYPVIGKIGKPKTYDRLNSNMDAILSFDAKPYLKNIACDTLIIGGEDDRIVGAEASEQLHDMIAGSELHMYEGLGHAAYEEAKDFNERVYAFLKK